MQLYANVTYCLCVELYFWGRVGRLLLNCSILHCICIVGSVGWLRDSNLLDGITASFVKLYTLNGQNLKSCIITFVTIHNLKF